MCICHLIRSEQNSPPWNCNKWICLLLFFSRGPWVCAIPPTSFNFCCFSSHLKGALRIVATLWSDNIFSVYSLLLLPSAYSTYMPRTRFQQSREYQRLLAPYPLLFLPSTSFVGTLSLALLPTLCENLFFRKKSLVFKKESFILMHKSLLKNMYWILLLLENLCFNGIYKIYSQINYSLMVEFSFSEQLWHNFWS